MKVVFLDIDGVLNSARWFGVVSKRAYRRAKGTTKKINDFDDFAESMLDPNAVRLVNQIRDRTGCEFVLSSAMRIAHSIDMVGKMLAHQGFIGKLIGKTPAHIKGPPDELGREFIRGYEISAWLDEHPEVDEFVILDDGSDMGSLRYHLVQTHWMTGINQVDADKAVALLGARETPDGG